MSKQKNTTALNQTNAVFLMKKGLELRLSPFAPQNYESANPIVFFKATQDARILCTDDALAEIIVANFFGDVNLMTAPSCPPYSTVQAVQAGGRNAAWFVTHPLFSGVVRQYRRGGVIGKLIRSRYWWQNEEKTRSWEEFKILFHLYTQGVHVAKPIAAIYLRRGLSYQAALITERIPHTVTLVQAIQQIAQQSPEELNELATIVAQTIKEMHHQRVNHADLNAFNILVNLTLKKVYLIDFDKAQLTVSEGEWGQHNLDRLERHLIKVLGEEGQTFARKIKANYASF